MAILDEIRNEILKNAELDGNEKICLIALLCSSDLDNLAELAALMGVTRNTAQMTVRSLRMKGYLKDSQIESDEAEISALRRLMSREKPLNQKNSGGYDEERAAFRQAMREDAYQSSRFDEGRALSGKEFNGKEPDGGEGAGEELSGSGLSRMERAERLSKVLEVNPEGPSKNSYKSRAAALYKKDSNVAKAAKKMKDINMQDYDADNVMETLESSELSRNSASSSSDLSKRPTSKSLSARSRAAEKTQKAPSLEDRVMDLVEESITRSEAAIILGFAGGDYEKVEATYKRIRGTQIKDKVDALVKLLQAD